MTDIKDFILQLEDTTLSLEEQQAALLMIEQTLIENKQIQEKTLEESSNLIVDAVRTVEEKLDAKFTALKTDPKLKGPKGDQGIRGENGKPGRDGIDGKDGINGHDGADGIDGTDGRYVVNVEVDLDDTLLVTLSDGTQIKTTKEIKGPKGDQGPQGLRGSNGNGVVVGGSTGQVLTKASNTDYDVTWSTNGSGTVTSVTGTSPINVATGTTTPVISMPAATGSVNGYLTSTDWTTFNNKGSGTVTSVGGTGTVSGISLSGTVTSSGNLTLGGTLDLSSPPAIGNTAANTGSFTTLNSTGGAVNGTIGATTPAAGTFTTITGQTEVLKGTGENLLTYSQLFTNSAWTKDGSTATASGVTAPDSTTTGQTLTESATTAEHRIYYPLTLVTGNTYTWSIYAKPNGRNWIRISGTGFTRCANFNISTGVVGAVSSGVTATISNAGNGWYRCIMTAVSPTQPDYLILNLATADGNTSSAITYSGDGTSGAYLWGAQIEVGSLISPYTATTSAAIYGTPTLSFSGVAGLGLQSDGSLYVSPAGTGALQAQATTSSTVGGNARGANAVDWQTSRDTASRVAAGQYSVVSGGISNTANAVNSNIGGGQSNLVSSNGYSSGIFSGLSNQSTGFYSPVVGGASNTVAGYYNFVGGGFTNSGTSGSAVTTQSGTMNATTAVTLSGSNANIKVGQIITGTSIANDTYVAAISGTSLTLSKNASGSSTSTLSFYTPHGVVVGGGNNQATGSYSFIGGGGDAGTAANRNVASGDWSTVGGGIKNTASGIASYIGGGGTDGSTPVGNTASGLLSTVGGGISNQATATGASVVGGGYNTVSGSYSTALGGQVSTTRGIAGQFVFGLATGTYNRGNFQAGLLNLVALTSNATATVATSNALAASTNNQVILPDNSAYYFRGEAIAGVTAAGDTKGWSIEGVIKRGSGVASAALVGTPTVTSLYADAGAATWALAVAADTTNGGLKVTVTGQAATTIRWTIQMRTTEMTYA